MFTKESDSVDYGKGYPGYNWEVRLFMDGKLIARAFGPNVRGPNIGDFRDMAAVESALQLPDGPIDESVDVLAMLNVYEAEKLCKSMAIIN